MARGAAKTAQNQTGIENTVAQQYGKTAQGIGSGLVPALQGDVSNPTGLTPGELASVNTANQQSIGGSTAGSVGQGNLEAARTRNAGGFDASNAEAARSGQRTLSQNAVGVQANNALLAQQKRSQALEALGKLYGTNVQASNQALGLVPGTINAWTGADQATQNAALGWVNTGANLLKPGSSPNQST